MRRATGSSIEGARRPIDSRGAGTPSPQLPRRPSLQTCSPPGGPRLAVAVPCSPQLVLTILFHRVEEGARDGSLVVVHGGTVHTVVPRPVTPLASPARNESGV